MSLKPYQPSNGLEGEIFRAAWCDRCEREREFRARTGPGCGILSDTFIYKRSDPRYPREWVYDPEEMRRSGVLSFGPKGARCTAFEPEKQP